MTVTILDAEGEEVEVPTLADLLAVLPAALGPNGGLKVDQPISRKKLATPVVADGDLPAHTILGGVLTFANAVAAAGGTGIVADGYISDKDGQETPYDMLLFDQALTGTYADGDILSNSGDPGTVDLHADDVAKWCGTLTFVGTARAGDAGQTQLAEPRRFTLAAGETSLRALLVVRGEGATYTATPQILAALYIDQA